LRSSLLHAEGIIALDHFMKQRIVEKGIPEDRVTVLPPWAHEERVTFDEQGRQAFRRQHDLLQKFVVMYAGNHSPCHPLDTLIEAARRLTGEKEIVFCFVGGGSEQKKVREFAALHQLENIRCLPYQPFNALGGSLSAADLHVVVMGNDFVGIVHPCKLYNILTVGSPFLYIGPRESHITEIAAQSNGSYRAFSATHGDVEKVVASIREELKRKRRVEERRIPEIAATFSRKALLPRLMRLLQSQTELDLSATGQPEESTSRPGAAAYRSV
jgi:hypothetical protein